MINNFKTFKRRCCCICSKPNYCRKLENEQKTQKETQAFVEAVVGKLPSGERVESAIAAPAVDLVTLLEYAKGSELKSSCENCYFEDAGSFHW